jgi:uncharacterized protein (DUF433 family)
VERSKRYFEFFAVPIRNKNTRIAHHYLVRRSGKPCIRGMRITVQDVFEYLAGGMTEDQILEDFPELTREDINACFAFAADRERKLFVAPA